ncbi:MAG: hypothetical protein ING36_02680 [Burkholderiales bacterium]|jgi:hypothetical protein|nr:hypothetical protein [Burkholderiales bacterium]
MGTYKKVKFRIRIIHITEGKTMTKGVIVLMLGALLLAGCGGGGGGGGGGSGGGGSSGGDTGGTLPANVLIAQTAEPAGTNCPTGGTRITSGLDSNGNNVLDSSEVVATQFVCGATNGSNLLVATSTEPAGANCAAGGTRVTAGLDTNSNNVLDAGEVMTTSYVCNPPANSYMPWVTVTAATQAQPNTGYVVDSATPVTVTLPANASLAIGDRVAVYGLGTGGWTIAQNDGQSIDLAGLEAWTARESARNWRSVASSADGQRLVAVNGDQIYTSSDAGETWTARESGRNWWSVASSADGQRLVAVESGGQIYISSNAGVTWTARESTRNWTSVASSADGQRLVAVVNGGQIYTSSDAGVSWTARESARIWWSVASSADGQRLVAVADGGQIYTSSDAGVSWTAREAARNWRSVASSADGQRLVAVVNGGQIWTSSDAGVTWAARESARGWLSVASSADGQRLVAVVFNGQIYTSSNAGVSWTAGASARSWTSVASSADGQRLVAGVWGGRIYTIRPTTPGATGSLSGGQQSDMVELQYLGNGLFRPLRSIGSSNFTYQ